MCVRVCVDGGGDFNMIRYPEERSRGVGFLLQ